MFWLLFPALGEHRGPVEDKGSRRRKLNWPEEQLWGYGMESWLGFWSVVWKKLEVKVGLLETWNNWETSIQTTRASLQGKWKAAERCREMETSQSSPRNKKNVGSQLCLFTRGLPLFSPLTGSWKSQKLACRLEGWRVEDTGMWNNREETNDSLLRNGAQSRMARTGKGVTTCGIKFLVVNISEGSF